eukprot:CAMPEP_0206139376 /NCGR_PEP_ID=MMETSP1473-20131121/5704_1 /ASSEMBLY_ACC=CAM_ASM_001109 /TAXON_ID=1461547 /ORGANISM="Stichococcus sp, Strain RCC1054" /LENGTH=159 /DNA_ID=CAMNT_0053533141 /DNA_START=217 /DNA_END=696 /DNA_ORIENTATION=-
MHRSNEWLDVNPFGCRPFLPLSGGAAAVQAGAIGGVAIRHQSPEEHSVTTCSLEGEPLLGTIAPPIPSHMRATGCWKYCLTTLLGSGQVHQHSGYPLAPTPVRKTLMEEIVVRFILLSVVVFQDLHALAVRHRQMCHPGDPLLDATHHRILTSPEEHAC